MSKFEKEVEYVIRAITALEETCNYVPVSTDGLSTLRKRAVDDGDSSLVQDVIHSVTDYPPYGGGMDFYISLPFGEFWLRLPKHVRDNLCPEMDEVVSDPNWEPCEVVDLIKRNPLVLTSSYLNFSKVPVDHSTIVAGFNLCAGTADPNIYRYTTAVNVTLPNWLGPYKLWGDVVEAMTLILKERRHMVGKIPIELLEEVRVDYPSFYGQLVVYLMQCSQDCKDFDEFLKLSLKYTVPSVYQPSLWYDYRMFQKGGAPIVDFPVWLMNTTHRLNDLCRNEEVEELPVVRYLI